MVEPELRHDLYGLLTWAIKADPFGIIARPTRLLPEESSHPASDGILHQASRKYSQAIEIYQDLIAAGDLPDIAQQTIRNVYRRLK